MSSSGLYLTRYRILTLLAVFVGWPLVFLVALGLSDDLALRFGGPPVAYLVVLYVAGASALIWGVERVAG